MLDVVAVGRAQRRHERLGAARALEVPLEDAEGLRRQPRAQQRHQDLAAELGAERHLVVRHRRENLLGQRRVAAHREALDERRAQRRRRQPPVVVAVVVGHLDEERVRLYGQMQRNRQLGRPLAGRLRPPGGM